MNYVGQKISNFRTLGKLKQWQLANLIGKSPSWLCQVERGSIIPSENDLIKIARALDIENILTIKDLKKPLHKKGVRNDTW